MSLTLNLLFVSIVSLLAAVQSSFIKENNKFGETFGEGREATTTHVVVVTAATASTTTISTKLTCAILVAPVATTACRRKKQYWGLPLYYTFDQNDMQQFAPFNPTQVLTGVQPSVMPEFRNQPGLNEDASASEFNPPFGILQSSMEGSANGVAPDQNMFRVANPFFFGPLASFVSNIVSDILNPPVTVTVTR
ncbi:hypothetical protein DAPPUDRAFT_248908 [Daphnia pulex]|uniref:Uncharacterized protein n=1 Tax=Daphnia pulex TaxID=6669 RepID=E9GVG0_DAPPU|nr:hypothetical protein DAPPUDRAFT_248908 [Daphnia pulex]|eukprot:EFX76538.1 hypothetical protein DAPPUDRAFT_248908 [Daphnia pulex]